MISIPKTLQSAVAHHQAGRLDQAERLYRQILAVVPKHPESLHLLGVIAHQVGRNDIAVELIGQAIAVNPRVAAFHSDLGEAFRALGRLDDAIGRYRQALGLKPDDPNALNNLGLALRTQGKLDEAVACHLKALCQSGTPLAHNNLGNALKDQGKLDEAIGHYQQALRLKPDYAEALYNLGLAFQAQGRTDEAIRHYTQALAVNPNAPETLNNLGNALQSQGRLDEAAGFYLRALGINPTYVQALNNLGNALQALGRHEEAVGHYSRALEITPDDATVLNNLGAIRQEQGRQEEAMALYARALRVKPDLPDALTNLGLALQDQGRREEALAHFERALEGRPDFVRALFARCIAQIPIIYDGEDEIERRRLLYRRHLERLSAEIDRLQGHPDLADGIGFMQPFLLAYQGRNDRDLQRLYGALVCRIMEQRTPPAVLAEPPASDEPVRVGIVCGFFSSHTIWKLYKGWISQLDRRRFRLFGYHTGSRRDAETALAASGFERFVEGPWSASAWRDAILADRPHVLIYPELGMTAMTARLAAQRLAPVQCLSWGHPDTSGYSTLDYFLSSDLMEPAEAQEHYTERLVRLPNLSLYYEPAPVPPKAGGREAFGLPPDLPLYWCCQSLYKYLPQYDDVFPRIALAVGACRFVFISYPKGNTVNEVFRARLRRAFSAVGLDSDAFCIFLPRLDQDQFFMVSGLCDVFLDSIGWSGGTTTLESLVHDMSIVTLPGSLMRSRHSMAILTRMGLTETIADTTDAYVAMAARLALDDDWRSEVRKKVSRGKDRVYRDRSCIAALEDFLDRVVRH